MEKAQEGTRGLTRSLQHPKDQDKMEKGQDMMEKDQDRVEKGQDRVGGLTQSLQHPADHGGPPVHVQLGTIFSSEAAGPCGQTGPGWAPLGPTQPLPTKTPQK